MPTGGGEGMAKEDLARETWRKTWKIQWVGEHGWHPLWNTDMCPPLPQVCMG